MNMLLNTSFRVSLLRNSIIQFIWWVIFFPGFFSGDSFGAVLMAKTGNLGNSFTASWALYVRIFSLHGNAIALLTLINGLLLVYSVTRLGYSLFSNRPATISTFLLTLTPVVSGMGITLWHDILMTAGIVLVTTFFINFQKNASNLRSHLYSELIPGAVLTSFRPNGLPTLFLYSALCIAFLAIKKVPNIKEFARFSITAMIISASVTLIGSNLILGMSPINNYYAQEWMRSDISCYSNSTVGKGFVEKEIPGIGSTET